MCIFSSSFQNIYLVRGTIGEADLKNSEVTGAVFNLQKWQSSNMIGECNAYVDATKIFRNIIT